ncbi:LacI family DNA-binding transcriptional regulator [Chimaeribacter arupi]|uniref:LacI family DNA-binding transcriptional regulator n=2 Tax=Yersiniaceae TaxID=1903411 RepID=A0A2N5EKY2_9GAMM|nr:MULTISPECIES: LacI family DNA-binding transcriptional regulator [Yersiniaceae]MBS0970733.1 LacI family DNA-binding transcriptional regulator [Nissabacter archeti]MDV5142066.1 LacI family DNA-binding transcriptional regulator [Chimaeribacter arupi]PLR32753.1 LacI family DNA-binding transcriptional regulator [Chimaeribacter arupi]PLR43136.1 LacI family DNA-binding transcriptional regulator [Chimaeribacter arupi]PLR47370.1 LacI family DNA-binding transcriptional regulator [Chimaeribacter arupi
MDKPKRVTIKDIAQMAGVSKSTASIVLSGRGKELRVSESTQERVMNVARMANYQPSIHARSLTSSRSHTLGLVVPEMTNHGFATFSHALETLCRDSGLQLLIACTDENTSQETLAVNNLIQRQVDGIIVASSMLNDTEYQRINKQLPVVLFDRHLGESSLPLVITESIEPTARLVEALAEGVSEFYFIGGQPRISPTRDRLAGYRLGLERAGLAVKPEWINHGHYNASSGYEMFADLVMHLGRLPEALFCSACGLQEGVLRYLSQHKLLNAEIKLCSFDDHYLYDALSVKIDTVVQDNRQLAWNCFEMINQLIEGVPPQQPQRYLPAGIRKRH